MEIAVKNKKQVSINIPLSALRCILHYPKEKKIICEISESQLKKVNKAETLDEIISASHLDYIFNDFKTFTNAKDLISDLRR
ncbi:MAG: hypothetical protein V1910_00655 [bacterium]